MKSDYKYAEYSLTINLNKSRLMVETSFLCRQTWLDTGCSKAAAVHDKVVESTDITVRLLMQESNLSIVTLHRILRKDLNWRTVTSINTCLFERQIERRMNKRWSRFFNENPFDEAYFHLEIVRWWQSQTSSKNWRIHKK